MGELGHPGPDQLAHRFPRGPQISADLLDLFRLLPIRSLGLHYRLPRPTSQTVLPDELGRIMTANVTGHSGRRWLRFGANFARLFITVARKALARLQTRQVF